ncbi:uncharacterized protein LOC135435357 [Drosophila montana]|uniref:uncharacterized protein LOC135435357 n=1 Tax=Drosophila montana TaxID=40370 RepID=UPI00313DC37E
MSGTLMSVLLFILICAPTLHAQVLCKIPEQGKMPIKQKRDMDRDEYKRSGAPSPETMAIEPDAFIPNENRLDLNEDGGAVRPGPGKLTKKKQSYRLKIPYRQSTFMRNPNYRRINRKLDKIAERMFMLQLPLPHPGAQPGSSNGCDQSTVKPTAKFIKVKS